ncbi:MAG: NADP-dependent malic enzyme [Phycisphaerae bacterium]
MSLMDALQDRFQRNIVFEVQLLVTGEGDRTSQVVSAISEVGPRVTDVELEELTEDGMQYAMTLFTAGDDEMAAARKAIEAVDDVEILDVIDVAMESHRGGSCHVQASAPITSNTDLRIVYTPGVARVCKAIEKDPSLARDYTGISNKVAICTNGTAILGLGDIGPVAGMPVMEGKSAIFWEFAGVSAEPILVNTQDPDEFIKAIELIGPTFGAIQVEDVKAPECFKITRELDNRLPVPVMHDDQHGTAAVVMAALFSALNKTGKKLEELTVSMVGAGAAGTAIADLLMHEGVEDVILCDRRGALHRGRDNMNAEKTALAERTNKQNRSGDLAESMKGTDLFIGVSGPGLVTPEMVRNMNDDPIIFALANPVSEISRDDALRAGASVYADGRMINNAVCYPGIFRGALDAGAERITVQMVVAAAHAAANCVQGDAIMPEMMDPHTHMSVAEATRDAAGPGDPLLA